MPRRRFKKKTFRKRRKTFRRRRKSSLNILTNRTVSAFPDRYATKLKYAKFENIASGVSGTSGISISLNGITDILGGGEQPLGFDELTPIYERYVVTAASISLRLINNDDDGLLVALIPATSNTLFGGLENAVSQPYSKQVMLGNALAKSQGTLKHYMMVKALTGKKPFSEEDYVGTAVANPIKEVFWMMFWQNMLGNFNFDISVVMEVIYYVSWFQRSSLANS